MFTPTSRIALFALAIALTGCGERRPAPGPIASAEADQRDRANAAGRIVCALGGGSDFARQCTVEEMATDQGTILTLRHPDGGFHRLLIIHDGRGVIAADGAEAAKVTVVDKGMIEVAIGGARYRLPARVGPLPK